MPKKAPCCPYGPTNSYTIRTPLGEYTCTSCPKGLHNLCMTHDAVTDENFIPDPTVSVSLVSQLYQDNGYTYTPAVKCFKWMEAYFSRNREEPFPEICTFIGQEGTFTHRVWFTLLKSVPFGKTITYQGLARLCGNERACRAVGQAMRNNPVGLVIPCHRVIPETGGIGNYHHGTRNKVKHWLLTHEGSLPNG